MTIILYCRRNVGLIALSYFVAKGHTVRVMTDDDNVKWLARSLGCPMVEGVNAMGRFDFLFCVHGNKILETKYLAEKKTINIHPCLFKYPGHNPIKRYIENGDTLGSVESQYMIEEVDAGPVIHQEMFSTPVCHNYADFYNVALPFYYKVLDKTMEVICA